MTELSNAHKLKVIAQEIGCARLSFEERVEVRGWLTDLAYDPSTPSSVQAFLDDAVAAGTMATIPAFVTNFDGRLVRLDDRYILVTPPSEGPEQ